ncbi:Pyridoxal phosphate-dependent decarboxylase [Perkinsus sp. BL_2016]|nr:Pyridoxal phosphate-dependent decarboxylase [Perkinsus sp. BL_2016]
MEIKEAEISKDTTELSLQSVEKVLDKNTILIIASAPSFPYGTIDPIEDLAVLAYAHGIFLHVDACLGGFLIPFVRNGWVREEETAGFWPKGVSSISCDPHKYGYTPKGCSVLLWRNTQLRHFQYSYLTDWSGGVYATPTICGSRPGFPAVAAWATLRFYGKNKYKALADEIVSVTRLIAEELPLAIPELYVIGRVDLSVVAFAVCDKCFPLNIFDIADEMKNIPQRHWHLNILQNPAAVHLAVTGANLNFAKRYFIADLRQAVNLALAKQQIGSSDTAAFYGASAQAPIELLDEFAALFLDASYDLAI